MNSTPFLNWFGGLPDLTMRWIPNFALEKNTCTREEYLAQLEYYAVEKWPAATRPFLRLPEAAPPFEFVEPGAGGFETIKYPSRYEPANPALASHMGRNAANANGYLTLWRHGPNSRGSAGVPPAPANSGQDGGGPKRPLVLCIHGFMMGLPRRAQRMFKIDSLLARGLDVALYIQPFHWKREGSWRQIFVNPNDVPLTIETLAQTVHDVHSAVLLLRSLGYEKIGAIGASLGGYAAALYAAAGPTVDFLFTTVPAVDVSSYLQPRAAGFSFAIDDAVVAATRRALQAVSPMSYPPRFDVNKIAVVMHLGDRICDPRSTREWVEKWKIPTFVEVVGGHWLYFDHHIRGRTWYGWLEQMGYTMK